MYLYILESLSTAPKRKYNKEPRRTWMRKFLSDTCTTTVAVYHYFHYRRHVNNYFPRRPVNDYFLYIVPNPNRSENARFKGITAETMTRGRMHVV